MAHFKLVLGSALATVLLGGCNAVLGIDEAHSRDTTSSEGTYLEIPSKSCDAPKSTECSSCATGTDRCGPLLETCLGDHDCRKALNTYRGCLGSKCSDPKCFDALKTGPAASIADCVGTECGSCAGSSPIVGICDLYCSCMQTECTTVLQAQGKMPWALGNKAACMQECLTLNDLPSTHCRWTHCEIKFLTGSPQHCEHAISSANCPTSIDVSKQCTNRSLSGWACDANTDCCSSNCGDDNICAD